MHIFRGQDGNFSIMNLSRRSISLFLSTFVLVLASDTDRLSIHEGVNDTPQRDLVLFIEHFII